MTPEQKAKIVSDVVGRTRFCIHPAEKARGIHALMAKDLK